MFKDGCKIFIVIVSIVIMGILFKIAFFPVHRIDKSIDMAYEVTDKTLDGDNAIYNYEWFKQQEEDIKALYKKEERAKQELQDYIETLPENKKEWSILDRDEYSRLRGHVTAIGNMADDAMADYNAKSKMANRNIFKDNLPSNITRSFYASQKLTD